MIDTAKMMSVVNIAQSMFTVEWFELTKRFSSYSDKEPSWSVEIGGEDSEGTVMDFEGSGDTPADAFADLEKDMFQWKTRSSQ